MTARSLGAKYYDPGAEIRSREPAIGDPSIYQLPLPVDVVSDKDNGLSYLDRLTNALSSELDFQGYDTSYATHNFHAFPAKFPPQLPHKFIDDLTRPGEVVLDPMMGSGTTILEACLMDRQAIGCDIDPLAELITRVKTTPLDTRAVVDTGNHVLREANLIAADSKPLLREQLDGRWDRKTKAFVDYWFAQETQIELAALAFEIGQIADPAIRAFCELALSACIVTKSGGVSLAFDLAHTRPHRAKVVRSASGEILIGAEYLDDCSPRTELLTKVLRSPLAEFQKRFHQNVRSLYEIRPTLTVPQLKRADAQQLPVADHCVDLIVTSPPYASNAIDYMRAHKFSLVWLGYSVDDLGGTRERCIGGESTTEFSFEQLPPHTQEIVNRVSKLDTKKGRVLHRYYSEMTRVLREMYRVLKPDRAAILVVATSILRGQDSETHECLREIGETLGFEVPKIAIRSLDRNRRMMPAGMKIDHSSLIQQRMHQEYVIGFYKPAAPQKEAT